MRAGETLLLCKGGDEKKPYITISVFYSKGGVCFGTYKQKPRGYYLSVGPIKIEDIGDGMQVRSFMAFSGYNHLLEETGRLSRKRLEELYKQTLAEWETKEGTVYQMVQKVLEEGGLELEETHESNR